MSQKKISISFRNNDVENSIYEYLKGKLSASVYIKELLLKEMEENGVIPKTSTSTSTSTTVVETEEASGGMMFDFNS